MPSPSHPASFHKDDSLTVAAANGGLARGEMIEHTEHFTRRLCAVTDNVWCVVGNGLSNQTFVEGPDGLIVIDTGESNEEMADALADVRKLTNAPIAAVIYSHFHYISGTQALFDAGADPGLPIWSHEGVLSNIQRQAGEVGPISISGLIHQFGILLPDEGPDALVGVGIGKEFRSSDHAPFTNGFIPPTETFNEPVTTTLAGLIVELTPAPSDADDSITIWFPELGVCVNNLVWPALFNVFPIRGEEYRDPRVLLTGFDHIIGLDAEHLVGTHGPPTSGKDRIRDEVTRSRDAVQFMWDQTVRGINLGMTFGELTEFVQLPDLYTESYLQSQHYGLVEHHVRQIHIGLRGWFDGDEATLFPVPPVDRARRLIEGFGGAQDVRAQADAALADDDLRWALELSTWLVRADDSSQPDRDRLAAVLRAVGRRTTAANIRNWCLTRARHLDRSLDTDRFRSHRFARSQLLNGPANASLHLLRVMLNPALCERADRHVRLEFRDARSGLHVRNGVAVPTDGDGAALVLSLERSTWADVLTGVQTVAEAINSGDIHVTGDEDGVIEFFSWFDHPGLSPQPA
jgi:alkyl sulfatase BDS1-like metallo-beta-lactamase superfamily hydrolase